MLLSYRNLVLSSAALCATAAFATEQKRVEVPFSFVAKNHAYEAGSYVVSVNSTNSFVTLSEIGKPGQRLTWIVVPGAADPGHSKVSLTFDVSGRDHVLRTIQYETFATPNLDPKAKYRVEASTPVGE